jgi:hypothetical protein
MAAVESMGERMRKRMELEEKRLISGNERKAVGGRINKLIEAFL